VRHWPSRDASSFSAFASLSSRALIAALRCANSDEPRFASRSASEISVARAWSSSSSSAAAA
jgi:hypothetical protein